MSNPYQDFLFYLHPNGNYYLSSCPFCGDTEHHHHLSIEPYKKVFYCFRCHEKGNFNKLSEKLEVNINLLIHDISEKLSIKLDEVKEEKDIKRGMYFEIEKLPLSNKGKEYLLKRKVLSYVLDNNIDVYTTFQNNEEFIGFDFDNVRIIRSLEGKQYKTYHYNPEISQKNSVVYTKEWKNKSSDTLVLVEGIFDAFSSDILIENSNSVAMLTNTIKKLPVLDILNKDRIKYLVIGFDKDVSRKIIIKKVINNLLRLNPEIKLYNINFNSEEKDLNELFINNKQPLIEEVSLPEIYRIYNLRVENYE